MKAEVFMLHSTQVGSDSDSQEKKKGCKAPSTWWLLVCLLSPSIFLVAVFSLAGSGQKCPK